MHVFRLFRIPSKMVGIENIEITRFALRKFCAHRRVKTRTNVQTTRPNDLLDMMSQPMSSPLWSCNYLLLYYSLCSNRDMLHILNLILCEAAILHHHYISAFCICHVPMQKCVFLFIPAPHTLRASGRFLNLNHIRMIWGCYPHLRPPTGTQFGMSWQYQFWCWHISQQWFVFKCFPFRNPVLTSLFHCETCFSCSANWRAHATAPHASLLTFRSAKCINRQNVVFFPSQSIPPVWIRPIWGHIARSCPPQAPTPQCAR